MPHTVRWERGPARWASSKSRTLPSSPCTRRGGQNSYSVCPETIRFSCCLNCPGIMGMRTRVTVPSSLSISTRRSPWCRVASRCQAWISSMVSGRPLRACSIMRRNAAHLVQQQRTQRPRRMHGPHLVFLGGVFQALSSEELLGLRAQSVQPFYLSALDGESALVVLGPVCGEASLGSFAAPGSSAFPAPCREILLVLLVARGHRALVQCLGRFPRLNCPFHVSSPQRGRRPRIPDSGCMLRAPTLPGPEPDRWKSRDAAQRSLGSFSRRVLSCSVAMAGRQPGRLRYSCAGKIVTAVSTAMLYVTPRSAHWRSPCAMAFAMIGARCLSAGRLLEAASPRITPRHR